MMVVWHHSVEFLGNGAGFGASGVDLFFVISGFIMVVSTDRGVSPGAFMVNRIVRVVPFYWCATLLIVALSLAHMSFKVEVINLETVTKSLLFVPYESPTHAREIWPLLVPGWTLNYEMFFYALFALSLFVWSKWRLIGIGTLLASLVAAGYIYGPFDGAASVYTDPRLLEFLAGMVIANLWLKGVVWHWGIGAAGIVAGFGLLANDNKVALIVGAALVVWGSLSKEIRVLDFKPLFEIGNASYSIYLTHIFTLVTIHALLPHGTLSILASMCICAMVGYGVYRLIERPMTERLRIKRPARVAVAA
jgi:exopolysaccharide production protein ExoZ